ncbi:derriere protein [Euwallacea fornicatus]|uniref:derriere protein n=1 Tax=Euwallacea fornicatus TaxID=995702 RepID=UPI00338FBC7E
MFFFLCISEIANMKSAITALGILHFFCVGALNYSGKSYYFKTIGNNEFSVYNRVYFLNHNISDFEINPHVPQSIQNVNSAPDKEPPKPVGSEHFFLDREWDYDHKPINKTDLPVFFGKFYEERIKEPLKTDTMRIYFNVNRNSSSRIIKFDLSALKPDEEVSDADMYFYWPLENTSSIFKTSVVLRLYQFEKQFSKDLNESVLVENPDVHKLFNVIYVSKAQRGWQTFKIKKLINNWASGEENSGLLLTISSYEENKLISIFNDANTGVFRTFAVLNIRKNDTSVAQNTSPNLNSGPKTLEFNAACSKKPWNLNFHQLYWNNLILYPENGLMVYQCSGKCRVDQDELNNHVKLRHFVNGHHAALKMCCVPLEYRSFPIMFLDKAGNVVLKSYDQLVVDKCGCR